VYILLFIAQLLESFVYTLRIIVGLLRNANANANKKQVLAEYTNENEFDMPTEPVLSIKQIVVGG